MARAGISASQKLKRKMALPTSAKFVGWAVHVPDTGEFLYGVKGVSSTAARTFGPFLKRARLFAEATNAHAVTLDIKLKQAIVVAVFLVDENLSAVLPPVI